MNREDYTMMETLRINSAKICSDYTDMPMGLFNVISSSLLESYKDHKKSEWKRVTTEFLQQFLDDKLSYKEIIMLL